MRTATTFGPAAVSRTVRDYGYPPWIRRNAIVMMRRRGVGFVKSRRAVLTVNAATAHENWLQEQERRAMATELTINQLSPTTALAILERIRRERELAQTFVRWNKSNDADERAWLWQECLRMAREVNPDG